MSYKPFISIILPCRNEEKYIESCLNSLLKNSYPTNKREILVVDGMSTDNTRNIVLKFAKKYPFIRLLENKKCIAPAAMNLGIKNSNGEIIIRADAHAIYPSDYIEKIVRRLIEFNADNVGGRWIILPGANTIIAKAISLVLKHRFGVGNAYYRVGLNKPMEVDTVPFGCYRKEIFEKVGLFNENLVRNQDIELNLRIKRKGGKILLFPDIVSYYYARPTLKGFFKQNFRNGFWVIYSMKFAQTAFSKRHLIPLFFVSSVMVSLVLSLFFRLFIYLFIFIIGSYLILSIFFSIEISVKEGFKYFIPSILAFSTLHISYGIGSICGAVKLFISNVKRTGG